MTMSPGKPGAKSKKAADQIRGYALSFPESHEDQPWGHSAFKVKGKTFVFLGVDDTGLGVSVKLKASHVEALGLPFTEPTHYGLGKHGWVSAHFEPKDDVPIDLLKLWIDESFNAIAPKSILKQLASSEPTPGKPTKAPQKKSAKRKK